MGSLHGRLWFTTTVSFMEIPQGFLYLAVQRSAKSGRKKSSGHLWTICFSCCFLMWQFPLSFIWQDLFFLEKCRKKNPRWFRMKNLEASDLVVDGCESKNLHRVHWRTLSKANVHHQDFSSSAWQLGNIWEYDFLYAVPGGKELPQKGQLDFFSLRKNDSIPDPSLSYKLLVFQPPKK